MFDPAVMTLFWRTVRRPKAEQGREDRSREIAAMAAAAETLDAALAGRDWLAGEAFSYGDIAPGMLADRYALIPVAKPTTPHLDRWRARLAERPAYARWVMTPFDMCYEDWSAFEATLGGACRSTP